MSIVLMGSTSGSITLQEPAIAGNNTISVPAATGTMALLQTPSFATTIGVGGATASASGAGITFPATQSASTDANTLDDYEEGTWTPTYTGAGSNPTVSYGGRAGRYVKIGQFVWVYFEIQATSISGGSGGLQIGGLPFASSGNGGFSASYAQSFNTFAPIAGLVNAVTAINLTMRDSNTTISYIPVSYANNSAYLLGFANYTVA